MALKTLKTIEATEKYGHHRPSNVEVMDGISIKSVGPSEVGFEECSQRKRLASSFGSPVPPHKLNKAIWAVGKCLWDGRLYRSFFYGHIIACFPILSQ